jgi:hypothetical protein
MVKTGLGFVSCAAMLTALAFAPPAQAQAQPTLRVWQGEPPPPRWHDPAAESSYVGTPPRDPAETARLEAAADHILARYPQTGLLFGLSGVTRAVAFQPPQPGPDRSIGIMIRMSDDARVYSGGCGVQGSTEYLPVSAAWFDRPRSTTWLEAHPEAYLAMLIGWRQMRGFCDERLQMSPRLPADVEATPTVLAVSALGEAMGLSALEGHQTRDGDVWDGQIVGRIFRRMGVSQFSDSGDLDSPSGLARLVAGRRRIDRPLFSIEDDGDGDSWVWHFIGLLTDWDYLGPLFAGAPSADSDSAVRAWFDVSLRQAGDPAIGLDRRLPVANWVGVTAAWHADPRLYGQGVFRRDQWQADMVTSNAEPGCETVTLSRAVAATELQLNVPRAASNCLVVSWTGPRPDPELPPTFTLVAQAQGVDAAGLDALHLSADQNWEPPIQVEQGGQVTSEGERGNVSIVRPGLVVEDSRSGEAVKTWEVVFRPDDAFGDDRMTLVFTNLHPDGDAQTRPMNLDLTVGSGAHEARQALRGTMHAEDGDPCRDQQPLPLNVGSTHQMSSLAFQAAALDAEDFSIEGHLLSVGARDLQREMSDCGRVQIALFAAAVPGAPAGSPAAVCEARMAQMAGLGAQAMAAAQGGSMGGLGDLQPRQITFSLMPRGPITGPGTYPADASIGYEDLGLEQRGMSLPSSNHGEGSITVVAAEPGLLRVRYEARFEPQQCVAHLSGTISGELESVVALPLVGNSRREIIAPRAIELIGDRRWMELPVATRREMERQPRREAPEPAQAPSGPASTSPTIAGLGQCGLSPEDVRRVLDVFARQLPAEVRAEFLSQISADPDAARLMACTIHEGG